VDLIADAREQLDQRVDLLSVQALETPEIVLEPRNERFRLEGSKMNRIGSEKISANA